MKETVKNMVIVALVSWLSFFLLGGGQGTATLTQLGVPVFITVLGALLVAGAHQSRTEQE